MPVDDPIRNLVARVFNVPPDSLDDDSSPDTVKGWDSVGLLELVGALNEELDIELEPEDIMKLENVGAIRRLVQRKREGETDSPRTV